MRIHSLAIQNLPPFAPGSEIIFPPKLATAEGKPELAEVHLLVGPNGSGKTRLLSLLCAALGNDEDLAARVGEADIHAAIAGEHGDEFLGVWTTEGHGVQYGPSRERMSARDWLTKRPSSLRANSLHFVLATKGEGKRANDRPFALAFDARHTLVDCAVDPTKWKAVGDEPTLVRLALTDGDLEAITNNLACICYQALAEDAVAKLPVKPKGFSSKWSTVKERLESTLKRIIGADETNFFFHYASGPSSGLRVIWGTTDMRIIQLPDGIRSILVWLVGCISRICYLFPDHPSPLDLPFVLLIDEPEGHLHPKWQRQVLPAAQLLFPKAQIIAATHSAFAIGSIEQGSIHLLTPDQHHSVSIRTEACHPGESYPEVVREILGMSERYDPATEKLLAAYRELRDDALRQGGRDFSPARDLADTIAKRSDSLRLIMAAELRQLDLLQAQSAAQPKQPAA
jgi:energy-coupling factor transporter ATP-binding protein EcfA2